jgi:hypothetical protein
MKSYCSPSNYLHTQAFQQGVVPGTSTHLIIYILRPFNKGWYQVPPLIERPEYVNN